MNQDIHPDGNISRFRMFKFCYGAPSSRRRRQHAPEHAMADRIMLRIACISLTVLMTALGFLLSHYLGAMHASIAKIGDAQDKFSIVLTRVDITVRDIDRRVTRMEQRLDEVSAGRRVAP